MSVLISNEVGGDCVPPDFIAPTKPRPKDAAVRGAGKKRLLAGPPPPALSRDESANYVAARMANQLHAPLIANEYSPDLIDITRSLHHRQLFPSTTRNWSSEDRQQLIDLIYQPYRRQLRHALSSMLARSCCVIHLSVRTFDLRSNGKIRRADAGLLYDPARDDEVNLCLDWIDEIYDRVPVLRVRRNYPRRGTTDSITKAMRSEFSPQGYLGIELMLNRAWANRKVAVRDQVIDGICGSLQTILGANKSMAA